MHDDIKVKIDALLRENQNIRTELTAMIKNIQNCFFSFLASVGIFAGSLMNASQQNSATYYQSDSTMGWVTFLVSQIEVMIVVFSIYIQTDVFYKAAYIAYIEKKVNFLLGEEDVLFWESRICKDMWSAGALGKYKHQNSLLLTQRVQFSFYFLFFSFLAWFSFDKLGNVYIPIVQIIEAGIIWYLLVALGKAHENASRYINTIQPDEKMKVISL